jgi:hypothetical protein
MSNKFKLYNLLLISFCVVLPKAHAQLKPYVSLVGGIGYGTSSHESKRASRGANIGADLGARFDTTALEFIFRKVSLSNGSLGSDDFDTEISDFIYGVGARVDIGGILSAKLGFAFHQYDMKIVDDNNNRRKSLEHNGSDNGLYMGLGWKFVLTDKTDIFMEGTLVTSSEADVDLVLMEIGYRIFY